MKAKTINSVRRQVLIAGVCVATTPTLSAWAEHTEASKPNHEKKLVLSGRLTGVNGTAITGAMVELEHQKLSTLTDADGRFMLVSSSPVDQNVAVLVVARNGERSKTFVTKPSYENLESNGVLRSSFCLRI